MTDCIKNESKKKNFFVPYHKWTKKKKICGKEFEFSHLGKRAIAPKQYRYLFDIFLIIILSGFINSSLSFF